MALAIETTTARPQPKRATTNTGAGGELHALLARAAQVADECWRKGAKKHGLTSRQFLVMQAVAHLTHTEHRRCQTDLTQSTGIDRSTLADLVRRLVGKGLLARQRTKQDTRAYDVKLTSQGNSILRAAEHAAEATEKQVVETLSVKEAEQLVGLLRRVVQR